MPAAGEFNLAALDANWGRNLAMLVVISRCDTDSYLLCTDWRSMRGVLVQL